MRRVSRLLAVPCAALAALALLLPGGGAAAAADSGPPLQVPAATLAKALTCAGSPTSGPTPVLLVPGTTLTPKVNFSWNYEKVFTAAGRAWCAIELPGHAMGDIQIAAEYVTSAIRTLHARAGRDISVVGFSQGGMVPRWSLKYWPDTRDMVDDVIGIDPSNHGTLDAPVVCLLAGCAPAIYQQRNDSKFLATLNAGGETFAGLSYTQVYTAFDEIVVPNVDPVASSALHTGGGEISNTLVQDICPLHLADHLTMGTLDAVAYAVVLDALTHDGPAAESRISTSSCTKPYLPGLKPNDVLVNFPVVVTTAVTQLLTYPHVLKEPALQPYARQG